MTGKEFKAEKAKIQELRTASHFEQARTLTILLIEHLFQERKFCKIVEIFHSDICTPPETFYIFEVAYSLHETGRIDESEQIYEYLLRYESQNSAILNNLSHIKRSKNQLQEAFHFIQRAYELVPHDEIIADNYHQLAGIIEQQEALHAYYLRSLDDLSQEDDSTLGKLRTFLCHLHQDAEFLNNQIRLPEWKFQVLLETTAEEARDLYRNWEEKGYLRKTGERGADLIPIYEINPFLEQELGRLEPNRLPAKWIEGLQGLTVEQLERFSYFSTLQKIHKINPTYRQIAERDLNELFLNYLMKNEKAVIVLSGSLVEVVLLHYCEKNKITKLYFQRRHNRVEKRDLYECDLAEILKYLQEKKLLGDVLVHIGNISRNYRNFIHPGRELREPELLTQSKSDLCFISALEIINTLLL